MATAATPIDLTICDREPIHMPSSIQPHGIMLVAEQEGFIVRRGAGAIEQRLGMPDWEGQTLSTLIGELAEKVTALVQSGAVAGFIGQLQTVSGEILEVSGHLSGPHVVVELEPASGDRPDASVVLDGLSGAAAGFEQAASLTTLCDRAAIEFRRLTGFDRVMVYRFLDNDVGTVLAEDRRSGMRSFLNHHFPASDIPRQARALYLRNLIRLIPDANYEAAPLWPTWPGAVPLDMSDSSLRSVSPVHLQYLANMNVRASASVSIVKDGMLWGLIACHHETPRSLSYGVRAACRSLAGSLGRQIKAKEEAEGYRQRIRLRSFEDDMVALLSREGSLDEALSRHLRELRRMMSSDGVAVLRGRELVANGVCPSEQEIHDLTQWLSTRSTQPIFSTEDLSSLCPLASDFKQTASGLLAMTLSADEPMVPALV
jgi:two-component system, chemotaxis family, sensor kinase Cph1